MQRTDLAVESAADLKDKRGVLTERERRADMDIIRMQVVSERAAQELQKPKGRYITLCRERLFDFSDDFSDKAQVLANELAALLPPDGCVLVAGLGNRDITPDALGPLVGDRVLSTRHFHGAAESFGLSELRPVSVIAPGVLGQTGMETAEIVAALCHTIRPAAVIAVDALAAREFSRLTCTVQLSDTGIAPGAGVGNHRAALNADTLGIPVIALGVPTVVDAVTMAKAVLRVDTAETVSGREFMVTTREIDQIIRRAASLLSLSINLALHPRLTKDDILFLNS